VSGGSSDEGGGLTAVIGLQVNASSVLLGRGGRAKLALTSRQVKQPGHANADEMPK
jgi:hypothetical protein